MSQESESPHPSPLAQPTRELLLAQALELCVQAERRVPGSSDLVIAHQPAWTRTDLRRLTALATALDAVATNAVMSEDFRRAARSRLMARIGAPRDLSGKATAGRWLWAVPPQSGHHHVRRGRPRKWLWRGSGGALLAAVLVAAASLTASANALPGEPLYSVKQAREELGLRLTLDDQARALALLHQADARLEETARLLQQGRTQDVAQATQRFDDVVDRATTTLVVRIADSKAVAPASAAETALSNQEQRIESLLVAAPEPARTDLREALVMAERSRAMVTDHHTPDVVADVPTPVDGASVVESPPTPALRVVEVRTLDVQIVAPKPTPPAAAADKSEGLPVRLQARRGPSAQVQIQAQPPASHAATRGDDEGSDNAPAVPVPAVDASPRTALAPPSTDDRTPAVESRALVEAPPGETAQEHSDDKPRASQQATVAAPATVQPVAVQSRSDSASAPATDHQGRDGASDQHQPSQPKSQPAPAAKSPASPSSDDRRASSGSSTTSDSNTMPHAETPGSATNHRGD